MLAHVPRKRNQLRFHKLFDLPEIEELDDVISCVVGQHVPPRLGNIYVTAHHLCFHCGIPAAKFKRTMRWESIQDITPEASGIHKNIVIVAETPDGGSTERLVFWSFKNRNRAMRVLLNHWNGATGRHSSLLDLTTLMLKEDTPNDNDYDYEESASTTTSTTTTTEDKSATWSPAESPAAASRIRRSGDRLLLLGGHSSDEAESKQAYDSQKRNRRGSTRRRRYDELHEADDDDVEDEPAGEDEPAADDEDEPVANNNNNSNDADELFEREAKADEDRFAVAAGSDLNSTMAFFSLLSSGVPEAEKNKREVEEREREGRDFCGILNVTIVQAKELPRGLNGKPSPYCTLELAHGSEYPAWSTRPAIKTVTPTWKEKFTVPFRYSDLQSELVFTVYDSRLERGGSGGEPAKLAASKGLLIGKAKSPAQKYLSHKLGYTIRGVPRHDKWLNIDPSKSEGFRLENLKYCKLRIQTQFIGRQALILSFWRECAKLFDVDGDGHINRLEVVTLLDALGMSNLTDDEIDKLFEMIDRDCDGILSPEEIALYMEQKDNSLAAVTRCPACGTDLSGHGDFIFHLATCYHRNSSRFRDSIMVGMLSPFGAIKGITNYIPFSGEKKTLLVVDRDTGHLIEEKIPTYIRTSLKLMYNTRAAKAVGSKKARRILQHMTVSGGKRSDSPASRKEIRPFIEFHGLNPDEFLEDVESFENFNQFFYRKLKPSVRPLAYPNDPKIAVSPADCRCIVFPSISMATELWIKGRNFNLETLLCDPALVEQYKGCSVGIFRLAPQDYHRYHIPVDGVMGPSVTIEGAYYTVNPVAINNSINVYGENKRVLTQIFSPQFGPVMYVTIGATIVGSIVLTTREGDHVKRGDEHGYFAFGGSTIVLLFERGRIKWEEDLLTHSAKPVETLVRMGSPIGRTPVSRVPPSSPYEGHHSLFRSVGAAQQDGV